MKPMAVRVPPLKPHVLPSEPLPWLGREPLGWSVAPQLRFKTPPPRDHAEQLVHWLHRWLHRHLPRVARYRRILYLHELRLYPPVVWGVRSHRHGRGGASTRPQQPPHGARKARRRALWYRLLSLNVTASSPPSPSRAVPTASLPSRALTTYSCALGRPWALPRPRWCMRMTSPATAAHT